MLGFNAAEIERFAIEFQADKGVCWGQDVIVRQLGLKSAFQQHDLKN